MAGTTTTVGNVHIVLFKSVSDQENETDDAYRESLSSAGCSVTLVPTLDFEYVNLDELRKKIENPDDYEGVHTKPFLYPIGSLTKKNFKDQLNESNINVDELIVYKTKSHPELESNIVRLKSHIQSKSVCFIYFSPSGVKFSVPLLTHLKFDTASIKFVAIGPVTESALRDAGYDVAKTAVKPNPESVLEAVQSIRW